jgi:hypothetical protein
MARKEQQAAQHPRKEAKQEKTTSNPPLRHRTVFAGEVGGGSGGRVLSRLFPAIKLLVPPRLLPSLSITIFPSKHARKSIPSRAQPPSCVVVDKLAHIAGQAATMQSTVARNYPRRGRFRQCSPIFSLPFPLTHALDLLFV